MREQGVTGTERELNALSESCGYHAFAVSLTGLIIGERYNGLASLALADGYANLISKPPRGMSPVLLGRSERFGNVVSRYRSLLRSENPAALDLLERLPYFRHGADRHLIADIFLGRGWLDRRRRRAYSGDLLPSLSQGKFDELLDRLCSIHVVRRSKDERFRAHWAVADGCHLTPARSFICKFAAP